MSPDGTKSLLRHKIEQQSWTQKAEDDKAEIFHPPTRRDESVKNSKHVVATKNEEFKDTNTSYSEKNSSFTKGQREA